MGMMNMVRFLQPLFAHVFAALLMLFFPSDFGAELLPDVGCKSTQMMMMCDFTLFPLTFPFTYPHVFFISPLPFR